MLITVIVIQVVMIYGICKLVDYIFPRKSKTELVDQSTPKSLRKLQVKHQRMLKQQTNANTHVDDDKIKSLLTNDSKVQTQDEFTKQLTALIVA